MASIDDDDLRERCHRQRPDHQDLRLAASRSPGPLLEDDFGQGPWSVTALEVNLRKGGTTHPFSALRNLVPGRYDAGSGGWLADADGSTRAYRSSDNVVDPSLAERSPQSVIDAVRDAGLQFDSATGTGVVLHMLGCLAVDGRFGVTAIGHTADHADELYVATAGRRGATRGGGGGAHPLIRRQSTEAIRRTASSRISGEVAKLSRANPRPASRP